MWIEIWVGKKERVSFLAPVETNGPCHPTGCPTVIKGTLQREGRDK